MELFELAYFNLFKWQYKYPEQLTKPVYKKGIVGKIIQTDEKSTRNKKSLDQNL